MGEIGSLSGVASFELGKEPVELVRIGSSRPDLLFWFSKWIGESHFTQEFQVLEFELVEFWAKCLRIERAVSEGSQPGPTVEEPGFELCPAELSIPEGEVASTDQQASEEQGFEKGFHWVHDWSF